MGYRLNCLDEPLSWCQNLCLLSLAFIIDWRVVVTYISKNVTSIHTGAKDDLMSTGCAKSFVMICFDFLRCSDSALLSGFRVDAL